MKKYICRYCGKRYHSLVEAELCFDLDMKEIEKKNIKKLTKNGIHNNQTNAIRNK